MLKVEELLNFDLDPIPRYLLIFLYLIHGETMLIERLTVRLGYKKYYQG